MDSRDILQEPDLTGNLLEKIYEMQKDLLVDYIKVEGLPPYPFNINKKDNQQILKDFTARIIEELSEGWEALMLAAELTKKNQFWAGASFDMIEYNLTLSHLQNFGEEMSDALHFFMELLLYINIQPEDIINFLDKKKHIKHTGDDLLQTLIDVGYNLYIEPQYQDNLQFIYSRNNIDLLNPLKSKEVVITQDHRLYEVGSVINYGLFSTYKQILWDITHWLNLSRNFLKNKPWKQSEVMTFEIQYQESVLNGFINFLGFFKLLNADEGLVFFIYFKKNLVNQFRIKSKY